MKHDPKTSNEGPVKPPDTAAKSGDSPAEGIEFAPTGEAGTAQIEKLREEVSRLTDQLLRQQAEMDNQRKRLAREREEFQQFSQKQAVEALVPVLDAFELALANPGGSPGYRQGVELIYQQLLRTLQRMGLEPFEAKGKIFDPQLHEAIAAVESPGHRDQEVLEELQKGYMFKGRLLRPARVKVAKSASEEPVLNLDESPE